MKSTVLALASVLALTAGAVQAQSSVTLFGLVDTGVERLDNIGAAGDELYRMPTLAGSFASRWGMRGSEDLGGGMKAIFVIESGFGADSGVGQQGNRPFGRQAYLGVQSSWGTVTLGRQYSMLLWSSLKSDLMIAQIYGPGAFDLFLAAPRTDNSIAYQHKFAGFSTGVLYSMGRDGLSCPGEVAGNGDSCQQYSAHLNYDAAKWGVGAWVDGLKDIASTNKDLRTAVNGYVSFGTAKLSANYLIRDNDAAAAAFQKSTLWSVAGSLAVTPVITLEAQYYDFDYDDSANDANMLVLRGTYAFSKRTATYITMGHLSNDGASALSPTIAAGAALLPLAGEKQTGVMIGLRHSF